MGPEERIIQEKNRIFDTSLGDWTGDAVFWPIPGEFNVALFNFTPTKSSAKETLTYPYVLIEPNGGGLFQIYFSTGGPVGPPDSLTLTLTMSDQNYSLVSTFAGPPYDWAWPAQLSFYAPPDWNRKHSYIEINVDVISSIDSSVWFYLPSVMEQWYPQAPKKPQYLPIVGIG